MENEIWRPVDGYEGLYEVSILGRVKCLGKGKTHNSGEHLMKLTQVRNYYKVGLCRKGKTKTYFVHDFVAKAFPEICGNWFEGAECNHKDGNTLNNEASNLIVCTKAQHIMFHQQMRIEELNKRNRQERRKIKDFNTALQLFQENGKYTVTFYCRESKVRRNGKAAIEICIYQNGERFFKNSGYFAKPSDFQNGIYPEGFTEYLETFMS